MTARSRSSHAASARILNDLRAAKKELANRIIHRPRADAARTQGAFVASSRGLIAAIDPTPTENVVGIGIGEKISDDKTNRYLGDQVSRSDEILAIRLAKQAFASKADRRHPNGRRRSRNIQAPGTAHAQP